MNIKAIQFMIIEFESLRAELFGGFAFVIPEPADAEKWNRYNKLLGELRPFMEVN